MGVLDSLGWRMAVRFLCIICLTSCVTGIALLPHYHRVGGSLAEDIRPGTSLECDIPACFEEFQSEVSKSLAEDKPPTHDVCRAAADTLRQCMYSSNNICGCSEEDLQIASDFLYNEEDYLLHNCFGKDNNTCTDEVVLGCVQLVHHLPPHVNVTDPEVVHSTWVAVNEAVECVERLHSDNIPLDGCGMYPWLLVPVPRFNEWKWMMDLQGCPVFQEFADHDHCKLTDAEAHFVTTDGLKGQLKGYIDCLITSYEGVEECPGLEGYRVTMLRFVEYLRVQDCQTQQWLKSFLLESACIEPDYNEAQERNCLVEGFGSDLNEFQSEMEDTEKEVNDLEILDSVPEKPKDVDKKSSRDITYLLDRLQDLLAKQFP